jgi:hypothetical protein
MRLLSCCSSSSATHGVSCGFAELLLGGPVEELRGFVGIIYDVVVDVIVIDDVGDIASCSLLHLAITRLVVMGLLVAAALTFHQDFAFIVRGGRRILDAVILPSLHKVVGLLSLSNETFVI